MSDKRTRVLTKTTDDGSTEIVVLISHPMETGLRANPQTKEKISPHFIQKITFLLNGKEVAVTDAAQGLSKDPLISIRIKDANPGDKVKVAWSDNLGDKNETEVTVGKRG